MLKTTFVFTLFAMGLLQISEATVVSENEVQLSTIWSQQGAIENFIQDLILNLDSLVSNAFNNVAKVTEDISKGLGLVVVELIRVVEGVTSGILRVIREAVQAKITLLQRIRDALLRPALSNSKLALERLEKAVSMAVDDARVKFENAIQEMNDDAVGVLKSVTEKIQEESDEIKANIGGLLLQLELDENGRQCLKEQLAAIKKLANQTIENANSCVHRHLNGAYALSDNIGEVFDDAFNDLEQLVNEVNNCTDNVTLRMGFREKKESAKCLHKVNLKLQLAAARVSTDVGIKVGEALRDVVEFRLDLGKCSSDNLNQWETKLEEINDIVESCII